MFILRKEGAFSRDDAIIVVDPVTAFTMFVSRTGERICRGCLGRLEAPEQPFFLHRHPLYADYQAKRDALLIEIIWAARTAHGGQS